MSSLSNSCQNERFASNNFTHVSLIRINNFNRVTGNSSIYFYLNLFYSMEQDVRIIIYSKEAKRFPRMPIQLITEISITVRAFFVRATYFQHNFIPSYEATYLFLNSILFPPLIDFILCVHKISSYRCTSFDMNDLQINKICFSSF